MKFVLYEYHKRTFKQWNERNRFNKRKITSERLIQKMEEKRKKRRKLVEFISIVMKKVLWLIQ